MVFLTISNETLALILLAICVLPIVALIVMALVKLIVNYKKANDKYKENIAGLEKDENQREIFYESFGGEDNVTSVNNEMNRIIVNVKDIELVDAEKIKELGATGVLLAGNTVKCGFGDKAKYVYELMK